FRGFYSERIEKTWKTLKLGAESGFLAPHFFNYALICLWAWCLDFEGFVMVFLNFEHVFKIGFFCD
ncbi:MAG: hypothetical protein EBS06_07785, partial [Proteobacteria bacterium]|nr:hypothetical protein [Pseudomonadota bacterium]